MDRTFTIGLIYVLLLNMQIQFTISERLYKQYLLHKWA